MAVFNGRNTQFLLQREVTFRTAPSAAAFLMPFTSADFGDDEDRAADNSLNKGVLMNQAGCSDESPSATIESIMDLASIGQWLHLLWGAPSTSGSDPYTHVFTLDRAARGSALMELGIIDAALYHRYVGAKLNTIGWDVLDGEQNISLGIIPAARVFAVPTSAFDGSPTSYTKDRACKAGGNVADVVGATTIGRISAGNIEISNDLQAAQLADGLSGFGAIELGDPTISGSVTALYGSDSAALLTYGDANTATALALVSTNSAGDATLTVDLAAVEWSKIRRVADTSAGLVLEADWKAVQHATAPTITLVNSVASY